MRKELQDIALIDRFIAGDLSSEELQEFNNRLVIDADFKEKLELQQELRLAMNRASLRKEVLAAQKGVKTTRLLKRWGTWGALVLAIGGSAAYFASFNDKASDNSGLNNQSSPIENPIQKSFTLEDFEKFEDSQNHKTSNSEENQKEESQKQEESDQLSVKHDASSESVAELTSLSTINAEGNEGGFDDDEPNQADAGQRSKNHSKTEEKEEGGHLVGSKSSSEAMVLDDVVARTTPIKVIEPGAAKANTTSTSEVFASSSSGVTPSKSVIGAKNTSDKITRSNSATASDSLSAEEKADSLVDRDPYDFKLAEFESKKEVFNFNPHLDTLIRLRENLEIFIPAGSFQARKNEKLKLEIESYMEVSEMLLKGLTTRSDKGDLETNGMVNVRVFDKRNKEQNLIDGKSIVLGFPQVENGSNFVLFDGKSPFDYAEATTDAVSQDEMDSKLIAKEKRDAIPLADDQVAVATFGGDTAFQSTIDSSISSNEKVLWYEQDREVFYPWGMAQSYSMLFPKHMFNSMGEEERDGLLVDIKRAKHSVSELSGRRGFQTNSADAAPNTIDSYGLKTRGDFLYLGRAYERMVKRGVLPSGYYSFLVDMGGDVSSFEYDGKMSNAELGEFPDSLKAPTEWTCGSPHGILGKNVIPKKKVAVVDLDWRKYRNDGVLGPQIQYLATKRGMKFPPNKISIYKSLKLRWLNCDRYLTSTHKRGNITLKGHADGAKTFLVFKKWRTVRGYDKVKKDGSLFFRGVPRKSPMMMVSINETEEGIFIATSEFDELKPSTELSPYKKVTRDEFAAFMDKINNIHKGYRKRRKKPVTSSIKN